MGYLTDRRTKQAAQKTANELGETKEMISYLTSVIDGMSENIAKLTQTVVRMDLTLTDLRNELNEERAKH